MAKSLRSNLEKEVLKYMIDNDVDQVDIANFENVTPAAINNRLKRLTSTKVLSFKKLVRQVAKQKHANTPHK